MRLNEEERLRQDLTEVIRGKTDEEERIPRINDESESARALLESLKDMPHDLKKAKSRKRGAFACVDEDGRRRN